jgi:hypothetical protein
MSVYLSERDKQIVLEARRDGDLVVNRFWTALMSRPLNAPPQKTRF